MYIFYSKLSQYVQCKYLFFPYVKYNLLSASNVSLHFSNGLSISYLTGHLRDTRTYNRAVHRLLQMAQAATRRRNAAVRSGTRPGMHTTNMPLMCWLRPARTNACNRLETHVGWLVVAVFWRGISDDRARDAPQAQQREERRVYFSTQLQYMV